MSTCEGRRLARVLNQFPFSFEPVIELKVNAVSYGMGNKMVTVPLPELSLRMVMRAEFDAHLLKHAQAEVREGVAVKAVSENDDSVTVTTSSGESPWQFSDRGRQPLPLLAHS